MPAATEASSSSTAPAAAKASSDTMSSATSFSYAQAAKGRAASTTPSAAQSTAESGATTPAKVDPPAQATSNGHADKSVASSESTTDISNPSVAESAPQPATISSLPAINGSTDNTSSQSKEEDAATLPPHLADSDWRSPRTRNHNHEHHTEGPERRSKKGKGKRSKNPDTEADKEKEKEKPKEEPKPEVFVEAAAPAVNIWQQRKDAQAAKVVKAPVETVPGSAIKTTMTNSENVKDRKLRENISAETLSAATPAFKPTKKVDSTTKKDEVRRNAPRGARVAEKEEKASPALPPVADAISWPTPETAVEEDKRKVHEKSEKEDIEDTGDKPKPKKAWVTVPFTPSVTFNTPLPARGGARGGARAGRGGREATGRGGHTGDGADGANSHSEALERTRSTSSNRGSSRAASLPPQSSKMSVPENQASVRDQLKQSGSAEETQTENQAASSAANGKSNEGQQSSFGQQQERHSGASILTEVSGNERELTASFEQQVNGSSTKKYNTNERKSEVNGTGERYITNGQGQPREGGRGGRGRGGYRNSHTFGTGQQPYINGHGQQSVNGYTIRQNTLQYSPPSQQSQHYVGSYASNNHRGRGNGARAQSIPNGQAIYARYPQNMSMTHINHMQSPTAYECPAQPFINWEPLPMVIAQVEYYLSVDNLCKDMYLRKQMDSQGFVTLSLINQFKRIQQLSPDIEVFRAACQQAIHLEAVTGDDGIDRIRKRDGWELWVLPTEDRHESARNAGPTKTFPLQDLQGRFSQAQSSMYSPNGSEPAFYPSQLRSQPIQMTNGGHRGDYEHHPESSLSAGVPDFTPGQPMGQQQEFSEIPTTFSDAEIPHLVVAYNQKSASEKPKAPFHTAGARTFSNGSISTADIPNDLSDVERSHKRPNGTSTSESFLESYQQLFTSLNHEELSPTIPQSPPVMWLKDQKEHGSINSQAKQEFYTVLHHRFVHERHDYDSRVLYEFLSHFLVRNFNPGMYQEFRRLAISDAQQRQQSCGLDNLITFYDQALNNPRGPIPEVFARHYIDAIHLEASISSEGRSGFAKLRSSWRSGGLDLRSRKRLEGFADNKLREELDG